MQITIDSQLLTQTLTEAIEILEQGQANEQMGVAKACRLKDRALNNAIGKFQALIEKIEEAEDNQLQFEIPDLEELQSDDWDNSWY